MAQITFRLQFLHELLKRKILVSVGSETYCPHTAQQLSKAGIAGKIRAQNQRVDEEPDKILHLGAITARYRRTDNDSLLARVAIQQRLEGGEQCHKQSNGLTSAQILNCSGQKFRQYNNSSRPTKSLSNWPGMVGGKFHDRQVIS